MDDEVLALLGQIVDANVDSAARTANVIIEGLEADRLRLSRVLLGVLDAFEREPMVSRSMIAVVVTAWGKAGYLAERVVMDEETGE